MTVRCLSKAEGQPWSPRKSRAHAKSDARQPDPVDPLRSAMWCSESGAGMPWHNGARTGRQVGLRDEASVSCYISFSIARGMDRGEAAGTMPHGTSSAMMGSFDRRGPTTGIVGAAGDMVAVVTRRNVAPAPRPLRRRIRDCTSDLIHPPHQVLGMLMLPRVKFILMASLLVATSPPSVGAQEARASTPGLQPGDVLEVLIWREEDLSGEFLVDETGAVTLPLLGRKSMTDKPLSELRDELIGAYRVHLNNPSITINPVRRIYVLGEVNKPGLYHANPTLTLAGAIALAEGATTDGDISKIRLVRDGSVIRERLGAGEQLNTADIRSGDQIYVDERGVFDRNRGLFLNSLLSLVTSVVATYIVVRLTN